jgi:hypothetical protein
VAILNFATQNCAREMKNYKGLVESNKNDYSRLDKITLRFNNYTNDFGLNWWKPLLILLVSTLLFYPLLLLSLGMSILNSDHWQYIISRYLLELHFLEFGRYLVVFPACFYH